MRLPEINLAGDGANTRGFGEPKMSLGWQTPPSTMHELCGAMREPKCFDTSSTAGRAAPNRLTNDEDVEAIIILCLLFLVVKHRES